MRKKGGGGERETTKMDFTYNNQFLDCFIKRFWFICASNVDRSHRVMPLSMDDLQLELELYELCLVQCWRSTDKLGVGWPRTKTRILNFKKKKGNELLLYMEKIINYI